MESYVQPTVRMRDTWTFEDLDGLDVADWWRYEIVDGGLVVSPSTGGDHEIVAEELRIALRPTLRAGLMSVGPMGVSIGASYLIPDLVVTARSALRRAGLLLPGDVLLAVEIVSPGSVSMDRIVKPAKYAAAGIAHFWRVETDPVALIAYELPPGADTYVETGSWTESDGVARPGGPFPVELDLRRLLAD